MEGLAQVCQTFTIEYKYGIKDSIAVTTKYTHQLVDGGPYRAIEAVSGVLGCLKEIDGGYLYNPCLASALFVTALCGRYYGLGPQPEDHWVSPAVRLSRMMDELGPTPGRFDMSNEEAVDLVDKVSRRIWGRSALEEISADIDSMEEMYVQQPETLREGLNEVFYDFINLRRRFLKASEEIGWSSLLPRAFPSDWCDQLLPWHVIATPGGDFGTMNSDVVMGRRINVPNELQSILPPIVVWGRLNTYSNENGETLFAPSDRAAWLEMLERHGPRAKLMLNGRKYRPMVYPELDRPVQELENLGISVCFDPRFEWRNREIELHV